MSSKGGCEPNRSFAGMFKSSMNVISCLPPMGTYTPMKAIKLPNETINNNIVIIIINNLFKVGTDVYINSNIELI